MNLCPQWACSFSICTSHLSYPAWFILYLYLFHSAVFFPNQIKFHSRTHLVCCGGGRCGCSLQLSSAPFWWQFGQLDFSILVLCWSETQVILFIWLKMLADTIHHQWTAHVNWFWCGELCCSYASVAAFVATCVQCASVLSYPFVAVFIICKYC